MHVKGLTTSKFITTLLCVAVIAGGCSSEDSASQGKRDEAGSGETHDAQGLVAERDWQELTTNYLRVAAQNGGPNDINAMIARAELGLREKNYEAGLADLTPEDFSALFSKLEEFKDTSDFDVARMLTLYVGYKESLSAQLQQAFKEQLLKFKYWQTEPTPENIEVDNHFYWTENHQIIFLADELIAGQTFKNEAFSNSGMTGQQHIDHAAPLIQHWIDLRAKYGFSEWLSNVYYLEDLMGLSLVAEFAEDENLSTQSMILIDVLLAELASHLQNGMFGSTHGRTYMKDKWEGPAEDTWDLAKMLFDDTPDDFNGAGTAVLIARAAKYRLPAAIKELATTKTASVEASRMGIALDPKAQITAEPELPDGLTVSNSETDKMTWFGIGAQPAWQVVDVSLEHINKYNLWDATVWNAFRDFRPIVESMDAAGVRALAQQIAPQIALVVLSQVNTYTFRTNDVMLSTAQRYRPGDRSEQDHVSQATIDPYAFVFTTHPKNLPPESTEWGKEDSVGYWTGTASNPDSAQYKGVSIQIYAPGYESTDSGPLGALGYLPYTHAFFPQERFDETSKVDNWTFGRKGGGFIALYSWRPTVFKPWDANIYATGNLSEPFDLVANGGPDNVFIMEVGSASDFPELTEAEAFASFVKTVSASDVLVTPRDPHQPTEPGAPNAGFDVHYESAKFGSIQFGWLSDLVVDAEPQSLSGYDRWASQFLTSKWGSKVYDVSCGKKNWHLDFNTNTRSAAQS